MKLEVYESLTTRDPLLRIKLWVPGKVKAKERPRFGGLSKGGRPIMFTPKKTADSERIIRDYVQARMEKAGIPMPHIGPVRLSALFCKVRPQNKSSWWDGKEPMSGGDLENLLKTVKDALNKVAWMDDRQVCQYGAVRRVYANMEGTFLVFEFFPLVEKPRKRFSKTLKNENIDT